MATPSADRSRTPLEWVTNSVSQSTTAQSGWISAKDMADRVGVNLRTIQRLANDNRIAHHRIPGTTLIRFSPEDVAAFDAEAQQVPA